MRIWRAAGPDPSDGRSPPKGPNVWAGAGRRRRDRLCASMAGPFCALLRENTQARVAGFAVRSGRNPRRSIAPCRVEELATPDPPRISARPRNPRVYPSFWLGTPRLLAFRSAFGRDAGGPRRRSTRWPWRNLHWRAAPSSSSPPFRHHFARGRPKKTRQGVVVILRIKKT